MTREFGELRRLTLKLTLLRKREKRFFDRYLCLKRNRLQNEGASMKRLAKVFRFCLTPRLLWHKSAKTESIRMREVWEREPGLGTDRIPLPFRRPPSETTFETLDLVNKPVVFWTPVEGENADERMWEFHSEDR